MTETEFINRWLADQEKDLCGNPIYRLVWSDDQYEYRHGTFNDYSDNGIIYLRTVTETRHTRKYSYLHERWILEKFATGAKAMNPELPESFKGSYEPLYVFQDSAGEYLAPNLKVVEFIINADRRELGKMNPTERREFMEQREKKELEAIEDSLGDSTALVSLLHSREAITVPSNYKGDENAQ